MTSSEAAEVDAVLVAYDDEKVLAIVRARGHVTGAGVHAESTLSAGYAEGVLNRLVRSGRLLRTGPWYLMAAAS